MNENSLAIRWSNKGVVRPVGVVQIEHAGQRSQTIPLPDSNRREPSARSRYVTIAGG